MGKHMNKIARLIDQLRNIRSKFYDVLLNQSPSCLDWVHQLQTAVAAIKTLCQRGVNWKSMTARLLEKGK